jgi:hypothetical protein
MEGAEAGGAEEVGLVDHLLLFGDPVERGREPVVEDQRHPLDQRLVAADHAVEPPEVVVAPGVGGGDRVAVVVDRGRAVEDGRVSDSTAPTRPSETRRSTCPGTGPKPARLASRSACSGPNGPR